LQILEKREVISLQKVDSLVVFEGNRKLKRFLRRNARGISIKIYLNRKTVISAFIVGSIQVMFPRKIFKIENGTIAVKAVYQGDVKLTSLLYLLLSITFLK
jgi:hypothetical protein